MSVQKCFEIAKEAAECIIAMAMIAAFAVVMIGIALSAAFVIKTAISAIF